MWTHESLQRINEIESYISNDTHERSAKFIDSIIEHTEAALPCNSLIGRVVTEILHPDIRELIFKRYRIVYRINENYIKILTVFEGHRLLQNNDIEL
jgi:toxin ParE1/3/4